MPPFRFVHAADLHLDSPFKGLLDLPREFEHLAETIRDATFKAFDSLVRLCIDEKADFLLVAGDVYGDADRSLRAQIRFREGLARLNDKGIHSLRDSRQSRPTLRPH